MIALGRFVRNVAQQLDHVGLFLQGNNAHIERLSRHRRLLALGDKKPAIREDVFIAANASVIGEVNVGRGATLWYGSVLRGDVGKISIGDGAVIGDNSVVHVSSTNDGKGAFNTEIGKNVIVENGAIIHGCSLRDGCKIEANSIIFDGAIVEENAIVGAGSILPKGKRVPAGQLWAGVPARFVRDLTPEEKNEISEAQKRYVRLAQMHEVEFNKSPFWKQEEEKFFPYTSSGM